MNAAVRFLVVDDFSTGRREFVGGRLCYEGDIADARAAPAIRARIAASSSSGCSRSAIATGSSAAAIAAANASLARGDMLVSFQLPVRCGTYPIPRPNARASSQGHQ